VHVFDAETGRSIMVFDLVPESYIAGVPDVGVVGVSNYVAPRLWFSPDGRFLVTSTLSGVSIWNARDGAEVASALIYALSAVFSRDGSVLAVTRNDDGKIGPDTPGKGAGEEGGGPEGLVLDVPTGEELFRRPLVRGDGGTFINVAGGASFAPDGEIVAFADLSAVRVWSTAGEPLYAVSLQGRATDFAFSPDGKLLAAASDLGNVMLSRAADGERVDVLAAASGSVRALAFSPNSRLLAIGNESGDVQIWDVRSRRQVASIRGTHGALVQLAFTPDGSRLAVATDDGSVTLYVVSLDEQIELARQRLLRGFTDGECRQYLHLETCPAS
jgi:WD40 repeat protein